MIVRAAPHQRYGWLAARTGCVVTSDFRAIEAVTPDGEVVGMVGYSNWTPNSAQMHVAMDEPWVGRALIGPMFEYPFGECARGVLYALVNEQNTHALETVARLGFREVYRLRDGFEAGVALVALEMRKEDCRWLRAGRKAA